MKKRNPYLITAFTFVCALTLWLSLSSLEEPQVATKTTPAVESLPVTFEAAPLPVVIEQPTVSYTDDISSFEDGVYKLISGTKDGPAWNNATPAAHRSRIVTINTDFLSPEPTLDVGDVIEIELFEDAKIRAEISEWHNWTGSTYSYVAFDPATGSQLLMSYTDGEVNLLVKNLNGADYHMDYEFSVGEHYALEIDYRSSDVQGCTSEEHLVLQGSRKRLYPSAHGPFKSSSPVITSAPVVENTDPVPPPIIDPPPSTGGVDSEISTTISIDILVCYSAAAVTAEGSVAGVNNNISQAMLLANTAHSNSDSRITLNLAHTAQVAIVESGNPNTDLNRITDIDGVADNIHTLRDTHNADFVNVFLSEPNTGGLAWIPSFNNRDQFAFGLSRIEQTDFNQTFAHELGHNMGLGHSKTQASQAGPGRYSFGAGWQWADGASPATIGYATLMTYENFDNNSGNGNEYDEVSYFSNPNVTFSGIATGNATDGDAARSLRMGRYVMVTYRGAVVRPPRVTTYPYDTSFETEAPVFVNAIDDDFNWKLHYRADTNHPNTGASAAQDGIFYYSADNIDNNPDFVNKLAVLEGDFDFSTLTNSNISFYYHMNGFAMGTLRVDVSSDNGSNYTTEWTLSGDQGDAWTQQVVDLSAYDGEPLVRIRFHATTGLGWGSNFALDNIVVDGSVSPAVSYSSDTFTEAIANDGSVSTTLSLSLANDTFTGTNGNTYTEGVEFSTANVPSGLSVVLTKVNSNQLNATLSGNAASHADTNDVSDLTITFNNAAFTGGDASAVTNSTKNDLIIDFADPGGGTPAISYISSTFFEGPANDGSVPNTLLLNLTNETYSGNPGDTYTEGSEFSSTNVPAGLTLTLTKNTDSQVEAALTGNAASHTNGDDISNLTITFNNGAFVGGNAASVTNRTKNDIAVDFNDPTTATISYSSSTFDEAVANDGSISNDLTLTLFSDTFTGANGATYTSGVEYTASNVPAGLTLVLTKDSNTQVTASLTGNAATHTNAEDINNLTISFNNAAFTGGNASAVTNATKADIVVDFDDPAPVPAITYSGGTFTEGVANDGSISNSLTLTLVNDTFTGSNGATYTSGSEFSSSNVPAGLTLTLTKNSATQLTAALTGNAGTHADAQDIANLTLTLNNAAFTGGDASAVTNATKNDIVVDFLDPYPVVTYTSSTFTEAVANDGSIGNTLTLTLANDTFTGVNGATYSSGSEFSSTNVPAGLTLVLTKDSDTQLTASLTGNAATHTNAQDVANLTITLNNAAFTTGDASVVTNATKNDIIVDFADPAAVPEITYSTDTFSEAGANDGSISNTVTLSMTNETFTGVNGATYTSGVEFNESNVPVGLTLVITKNSDSQLTVSLAGNAANNDDADDVSNLTIQLEDAAFTGGDASAVTNSAKNDLVIDFDDPAGTPPTITTQPLSHVLASAGATSLNVVATGTAPLSYQWYRGTSGDTDTTVGSNSDTLNITVTETVQYWVRVSNAFGTADSDTATITIQENEQLILPDPVNQDMYFGYRTAISGNRAASGAHTINSQGGVMVFNNLSGAWTQEQLLVSSDLAADHSLGVDLGMDGDRLVAGASGVNANAGAAYVFDRSGGTWVEEAKLTGGNTADDLFGLHVAIDNDIVVVGAEADDTAGNTAGAAYVYTRSGGAWPQAAQLTASDAADFDSFGASVDISNGTVIVGAYLKDFQGAVYVYTQGSGWGEEAIIVPTDIAFADYFGTDVAIDGDTAAIGSPGKKAVYIYTRSGTTWTFHSTVTGTANGFGESVDIDGNYLVVGAPKSSPGSAYLFKYDGSTWNQVNIFQPGTLSSGAGFGQGVAVDGSNLFVGASGDDTTETDSGSGYIYDLAGLGFAPLPLFSNDLSVDAYGIEAALRSALNMNAEDTITSDDMKKLSVLDLSDLGLDSIEPLRHAVNLTSLDLSNNYVVSDLSPLGGMSSLATLDLSGNRIESVADLANLTSLTHLDLSNNKIASLEGLTNLIQLETLNLEGNFIYQTGPLAGMSNLESLNLNDNQFVDISSLSSLTNLIDLQLANTGLTDISALSPITSLTTLNLEENKIQDLSALQNMGTLETLNLAHNAVSDITPLSGLIGLEQVQLDFNNLTIDAGIQSQIDTIEQAGARVFYSVQESVPNGYSGYSSWARDNFTSDEQQELTVGNALADPDNDGLVNLLEFALKTKPESSDRPTELMQIVDNQDGTRTIIVTYNAYKDRPNVVYTVEYTMDMVNWMAFTSGDTTVIDKADHSEVEIRYTVSDDQEIFIRLSVSDPTLN